MNILLRFTEVLEQSQSSANLLEIITKEPDPLLIEILRVFRKYVSPDTSV
jgi:hypothetical protein